MPARYTTDCHSEPVGAELSEARTREESTVSLFSFLLFVAACSQPSFGAAFSYNLRVSFDREQVEAKLALKLIANAAMPSIAWEALEAGLDGPATRRLASLEKPTYF